MTHPITTSPFADAWTDLAARMARALTHLDAIAVEQPATSAPTEQAARTDRVRRKAAGVRAAQQIWADLDERAQVSPVSAWRTFTTQVFAQWSAADRDDPVRTGLALALDYQRGYDPGVDAPALHLLERQARTGG